tara:strand:+ start:89 stop:1117 length:1029 start_codon:yes stop_codon:yes gene_type:complete
MSKKIVYSTVVGSYPQPKWLVNRDLLKKRVPFRILSEKYWNIEKNKIKEAQDKATFEVIKDQEKAGIDIISDGEIRRESYSAVLSNSLGGIDYANPGEALERSGHKNLVPRVVGPITWSKSVELENIKFLKANTKKRTKITIPGPFTMAQQAQDEYYGNEKKMTFDYAKAVNKEIISLFNAGVDYVQLDEPYMEARYEKASDFGIEALEIALDGVVGKTILHICFGYGHFIKDKSSKYNFLGELNESSIDCISIEGAQPNLDLSALKKINSKKIMLGVINLAEDKIENENDIVNRAIEAFKYIEPNKLLLAPDCGMKYLEREIAFNKLKVLAKATKILNQKI